MGLNQSYCNSFKNREFNDKILLRKLINNNLADTEPLPKVCNMSGISFVPNTIMAVVLNTGKDNTFKSGAQELKGLEEACISFNAHAVYLGEKLYAVAFEAPEGHDRYLEYSKKLGNKIKKLMEESLSLSASVGIGRSYSDVKLLHVSYREALVAYKYRFYIGDGHVIHIEDVTPYSYALITIPLEIKSDLMSKTLGGDKETATKIIEKFFDSISHDVNPVFLKTAVIETFFDLLGLALKSGQRREKLSETGLKYINLLTNCGTLEELKRTTKTAFNIITGELFEVRKRGNLEVFKKAMNYINDNYSKNITLEDIARHVHISPNHLSRGFKSFSGMNFSEYIMRIRIEKAKKLLLTTDAAVGEVGKMVGYEDPNYFGRVFKGSIGLPPSSFRSNLGH